MAVIEALRDELRRHNDRDRVRVGCKELRREVDRKKRAEQPWPERL